jgi:hypothetical protein
MNTTLTTPRELKSDSPDTSIRDTINSMIDGFIESLPDPTALTPEEGRGLIARYTSVLEGNFIYWMTATYLAVKSEEARPILIDNLMEEVRDAHPAMMRRFAIAAHSYPDAPDALSVNEDLTNVRLFLGKLSGVQSLLTMALFEGFIQRFMPFLAELAALQGSTDTEYTDVHGVCDIAHTAGLFQAFEVERANYPLDAASDLFEGVNLLRTLISNVVFSQALALAA